MDGGNSKTDVALVARSGEVLARVRGPTVSHQAVGARAGGERLAGLVQGTRAGRHGEREAAGARCLLPRRRRLPVGRSLDRRELDRHGLAQEDVVLNDCFAALRAGADKGWGVVLICGQGINAAAIGPNGRTLRFAGIGDLAGDWGGGGGLGEAALAAAIRARDGRGPRTSLERAVAAHFGRRTPRQSCWPCMKERLPAARRNELAPAVFREAAAATPWLDR